MLRKLSKENKGFTIIEVLIVLAIAGLIMLVVFLAVPALQRNSRNSGRRSDMGRFAAGVNDFVANNNGTLPTTAQTGTIVTQMGNMAQYAPGDRAANAAGTQAVLGATANQPMFRLVTGAQCGAAGDTVGGSARQAAVQYQLETNQSGAATPVHTNVCQNI